MSRTFHNGERRIRVKGIRHERIDKRKLAEALIFLAQEIEDRKQPTKGSARPFTRASQRRSEPPRDRQDRRAA